MIHSYQQMLRLTVDNIQTQVRDGYWVRAVPEPFQGGLIDRFRDAWAVFTFKAYAVKWPEPGDWEIAMREMENE